jgi:hypothetical protein
VLLSAVIGAAFSLLALAIDALRDSEERANQPTGAGGREPAGRLVIDVETASAGSSSPVRPASSVRGIRREVAKQAAALERLASAGNGGPDTRARQITGPWAPITGYAVPLVTAAQRGRAPRGRGGDRGGASTASMPSVTSSGVHGGESQLFE